MPTPETASPGATRGTWIAPWRVVLSPNVAPDAAARTFGALCGGAAVLLTVLSLLRHHTFHSSVYDAGIFHQLLWNTAHGRWFETSLKRMSFLGDHFSPSFALLAPLEWLPFPVDWLLAAQAAAAAFTGWNAFVLARRRLDTRTAFLLGCGTLFCPALYAPMLADFHPESFMAALISRGLVYLDRPEGAALGRAALCLLVALGGKEDAGLVIGPLGLAYAFDPSTRQAPDRLARQVFGATLGVVGLAWTGAATALWMPRFRPPADPHLAWFYLGRYAYLGASVGDIAHSLLLHPFASLAAALTWPKVVTIGLLVCAWGAAPLFGGFRLLAAGPSATVHFLSSRWTQFFFPYHYLVPIVPVLAWAAQKGAPRTVARAPTLAALAIFAASFVAVAWRLDPRPLLPRPEHAALVEAIDEVPTDAPVCVENWFGAHLAARRTIEFCSLWEWERDQYRYYRWPETSSAEWQVFDLAAQPDELAEFPGLRQRVDGLIAAGAEVVSRRDGVVVLRWRGEEAVR